MWEILFVSNPSVDECVKHSSNGWIIFTSF